MSNNSFLPKKPDNEIERLKALRKYQIMDTLPEQAYDDLTLLAARICDAPTALITFVDADRQWFKSKIGMDDTETPRALSFCAHAINDPDELFIVNESLDDARFASHPAVTGHPNVRFYAGAPLVTGAGEALGTICVVDRKPRMLSDLQKESLRALARQAMAQMELRRTIFELKAAEEQLRSLSLTDELTNLKNRRGFMTLAEQALKVVRRTGKKCLICYIDLDGLKKLNDTFGHDQGSLLIEAAGAVLQTVFKRESDVVARIGGDEFTVFASDVAESDREAIVFKLRNAAAGFNLSTAHQFRIEMSIGVLLHDPNADGAVSLESLVQQADQLMYADKKRRKEKLLKP